MKPASTALTVVEPRAESVHDRLKRMEADTRSEANTIVSDVVADLARLAEECIATGQHKSVPAGIRDILSRLGPNIASQLDSIRAIQSRA